MKVHEAISALAAEPNGEAEVTPAHVEAMAGSAPAFWKTLVLSGLNILRAACHLDGEQSAAWDTVVALIEAL